MQPRPAPEFFKDPERQIPLLNEAQSWLDTPCRFEGCQQGRAADEILLISEIYVATGLLPAFVMPKLAPTRTSDGSRTAFVYNALTRLSGLFIEQPISNAAKPGDLLVYGLWPGRTHLAIYITEDLFIHCIPYLRVSLRRFSDPLWMDRLKEIWRPCAWTNHRPRFPLAQISSASFC